MGTISWIIISIAVIGTAGLIQTVRIMDKRNHEHIEEVVRGQRPADGWFYQLLDDPKFKDYARMCRNLRELANKKPSSRPEFHNPVTPVEAREAVNQQDT